MFDIFENIRKVNDLSSDVTTKLDILVNNIFPQLDRKKYNYSHTFNTERIQDEFEDRNITEYTISISFSINHKSSNVTIPKLCTLKIKYRIPYKYDIERMRISLQNTDTNYLSRTNVRDTITKYSDINEILSCMFDVDSTVLYELHESITLLLEKKNQCINFIKGI